MEKLIKLLNEHRAELLHGNIQNKPMRYHYNDYVFGLGDLTEQNCILLIISKDYGFIKRLVDNYKIDMEILGKVGMYGDLEQCWINTYNALLMLLAISNAPIDDLISYLK